MKWDLLHEKPFEIYDLAKRAVAAIPGIDIGVSVDAVKMELFAVPGIILRTSTIDDLLSSMEKWGWITIKNGRIRIP